MKILVTGGAGFIGSHIADLYLRAGHRVIVVDNLSTGVKKNVSAQAKFYRADIRNTAQMDRVFARERPQILNHHAAIASVVGKDEDLIFGTNTGGTRKMLRTFAAMRGVKQKKIIFASSAAVYGEAARMPIKEDAPRTPISAYGLSKLLAEEVLMFYGRLFHIPYLAFRYSNVYGPRQVKQGEAGVVPIFRENMKRGMRPMIFGNGGKTRDYVFVEDVARANLLALRRGKNEIVNVSTGKETTDEDLYKLIAGGMNFAHAPHYAPPRAGEILRSRLSCSRARAVLGWKPSVALREGIEETLR